MKFVAPLNDAEIHTLTEMHRCHPSRRTRMRAHGILLSHQGFAMRHIADIYQVSRYAVSAWIERWHVLPLEETPGERLRRKVRNALKELIG